MYIKDFKLFLNESIINFNYKIPNSFYQNLIQFYILIHIQPERIQMDKDITFVINDIKKELYNNIKNFVIEKSLNIFLERTDTSNISDLNKRIKRESNIWINTYNIYNKLKESYSIFDLELYIDMFNSAEHNHGLFFEHFILGEKEEQQIYNLLDLKFSNIPVYNDLLLLADNKSFTNFIGTLLHRYSFFYTNDFYKSRESDFTGFIKYKIDINRLIKSRMVLTSVILTNNFFEDNLNLLEMMEIKNYNATIKLTNKLTNIKNYLNNILFINKLILDKIKIEKFTFSLNQVYKLELNECINIENLYCEKLDVLDLYPVKYKDNKKFNIPNIYKIEKLNIYIKHDSNIDIKFSKIEEINIISLDDSKQFIVNIIGYYKKLNLNEVSDNIDVRNENP